MADTSGWTTVPVEIAKRHKLYGVGGWLILVAIGCVAMPIRSVISLGPLYSGIDFSSVHPTLSAFVVTEMALNAVFIIWALGNLFMLFNKHVLFPRSYAAMIAFAGIFVIGDAIATKYIMDAIGQPVGWDWIFDAETSREIGRSVVAAAIWLPYVFVSRRVNVTFLNRVRNDDPLLRENVAEVF